MEEDEGVGEEQEGCEEDEVHICRIQEEGCRLNQGRNLWCGAAHREAEKKSGCDKADLIILFLFPVMISSRFWSCFLF